MGHVATLELPRAKRRELEPRGTWQSRSCPGLCGGSWSHGACGGSGAALSPEVGARATGHMAAQGLP
jgi:hypothetical protein